MHITPKLSTARVYENRVRNELVDELETER